MNETRTGVTADRHRVAIGTVAGTAGRGSAEEGTEEMIVEMIVEELSTREMSGARMIEMTKARESGDEALRATIVGPTVRVSRGTASEHYPL